MHRIVKFLGLIQLVRLAALLHYISHIPYGHTLEDQAGLLKRHDEDLDRIEWIFSRLGEEIMDSPHLRGETGEKLKSVLQLLLQQCKALYGVGLILKDESSLRLVKNGEEGHVEKTFPQIDQRFSSVSSWPMTSSTILSAPI